MKQTILTLATLLLASQAHAGAANTELNCKSAKGDLTLSGHVPGDFAEFQLTAVIQDERGKHTINLYSEIGRENARISVVEDLENGVYTLFSEDLNHESIGTIQLYALPKTVKYVSKGIEQRASFKAKIWLSGEKVFKSTDVTCTTFYSL